MSLDKRIHPSKTEILSVDDLKTAFGNVGSFPNDLLPERYENKITGQLTDRYLESLCKSIDADYYVPDIAVIVRVPKPGFTTRPAALMTLGDRAVYEALVAVLRPRAKRYMVNPDVCLWPREQPSDKKWDEFEKSPLQADVEYVVTADIVSYYDSIDHEKLRADLLKASGKSAHTDLLIGFLGEVMKDGRGLPQGEAPSDTLATLFLQEIDAFMISEGYFYTRHGDDMRIGAKSYSEARRSIVDLERALRAKGLVAAGSKCTIHLVAKYQAMLDSNKKSTDVVKQKLTEKLIGRLKDNEDELGKILISLDQEQSAWDLFYHGTVTFEEVIENIRPSLNPDNQQIYEAIFLEALDNSPDQNSDWSKEDFHQILTFSMTRLVALKSNVPLEHCSSLLRRFPDKTQLVHTYLNGVVRSHSAQVIEQIREFLERDDYRTGWQETWAIRTLLEAPVPADFGDALTSLLQKIMEDGERDWLPRVEAACALARVGLLEEKHHRVLRRAIPVVLQTDLLRAAVMAERHTQGWPQRYLDSLLIDPFLGPLVRLVRNIEAQKNSPVTTDKQDSAAADGDQSA